MLEVALEIERRRPAWKTIAKNDLVFVLQSVRSRLSSLLVILLLLNAPAVFTVLLQREHSALTFVLLLAGAMMIPMMIATSVSRPAEGQGRPYSWSHPVHPGWGSLVRCFAGLPIALLVGGVSLLGGLTFMNAARLSWKWLMPLAGIAIGYWFGSALLIRLKRFQPVLNVLIASLVASQLLELSNRSIGVEAVLEQILGGRFGYFVLFGVGAITDDAIRDGVWSQPTFDRWLVAVLLWSAISLGALGAAAFWKRPSV